MREMRGTEAPAGIAADDGITFEELQLAARNHGMPLEGLRYDVTPLGMHYLLIHFDIPPSDEATWAVEVGGVERPLPLSMADLRGAPGRHARRNDGVRRQRTGAPAPAPPQPTLARRGGGDRRMDGNAPRADPARGGPARGRGRAGVPGADHGIQGGVEHDYQRSLPVEEAMRDEVLLAYEVNGQPLPPQHGFPVRLVVPGWYGMTSVKWLTRIEAIAEPFEGFQQWAYRLRRREEDEGVPVSRMRPRALMVPPGFPEFFERIRTVDAGPVRLEGRAWSGAAPIARVEPSTDGGGTWADVDLDPPVGPFAWRRWSAVWAATPGEHELVVRATDQEGSAQPLEQPWNHHGLANNLVQRVAVVVR